MKQCVCSISFRIGGGHQARGKGNREGVLESHTAATGWYGVCSSLCFLMGHGTHRLGKFTRAASGVCRSSQRPAFLDLAGSSDHSSAVLPIIAAAVVAAMQANQGCHTSTVQGCHTSTGHMCQPWLVSQQHSPEMKSTCERSLLSLDRSRTCLPPWYCTHTYTHTQ